MLRGRSFEHGRAAEAAAARHLPGQYHAGEAVLVAIVLLVVIVLHVLAFAGEFAGQRESGEAATPAPAHQPAGDGETRQAMVVAILVFVVFVVFVVAHIVAVVAEPAGEGE